MLESRGSLTVLKKINKINFISNNQYRCNLYNTSYKTPKIINPQEHTLFFFIYGLSIMVTYNGKQVILKRYSNGNFTDPLTHISINNI